MAKGGTDYAQRLALGRLAPAEAVARVRAADEDDEVLLAVGLGGQADKACLLTPRQQVQVLRLVVRQELAREDPLPDEVFTDTEMAKFLHLSVKGWRELYESDPAFLDPDKKMAHHVGKGSKRILRWDRGAVLRHLRGRR